MPQKDFLKKVILSFFPAFFLLGYGSYLMYLFFSRKIQLFVHPDYMVLTLVGGIVLVVVGVLNLFSNFSKSHRAHGGLEKLRLRDVGIVLLPLLFIVSIEPKPLSTATALLRSTGLNSDLGISRQTSKVSQFAINTENRSLLDWIQLFNDAPEPERYKDLKAKLSGFVLKDPTLPADYFLISRFVISCCAADARPVGIPVKYDPQKNSFKNDQWIELEGVFDIDTFNGDRQPVLMLQNAHDISIPENPYAT